MKPRFIQTKHSGFGEWVAEVDPEALREAFADVVKETDKDLSRFQARAIGELYSHLTTIDMTGRVGLDAKHAAEAFRKKGFTVINLDEEE